MAKNNAVEIVNVTKTFKIPIEAVTMLKQKVVGFLLRKKGYRDFTPLKEISFNIKEGDFFGIVGKNGSGKSTLLKLIAGIYTPNEGSIYTKGKLVPFIELGVGFNPELSGRDNVYLMVLCWDSVEKKLTLCMMKLSNLLRCVISWRKS